MRRLIWITGAAGLLLVGGTTAAFATQTPGGRDAVSTVVAAVTGPSSVLTEVLEELVGDGTINQSQADAIVKALDAKVEERRAERQRLRQLMVEFLQDRTLSADELAQLPEDHPLRNLDQFLDDGQVTEDELRQLGGLGFGRGHHHGGPFGGPRWERKLMLPPGGTVPVPSDPGASPDATDPSSSPSGESTSS